MKIAVYGTGVVGKVLGKAYAERGHNVVMGTRDPNNATSQAAAQAAGVPLVSFAEAAIFGDIIILATKWDGGATENALNMAGVATFAGKIVMDAVNPLRFTATGLDLTIGTTDSAGEHIQRYLHTAKVVKAFNMIGAGQMVNPTFVGGDPDMYICGDDAEAKAIVHGLIAELGWRSIIDMGDIRASRMLEVLAQMWIVQGMRTGKWAHAFKLLQN
jgi:hypothetical protein